MVIRFLVIKHRPTPSSSQMDSSKSSSNQVITILQMLTTASN